MKPQLQRYGRDPRPAIRWWWFANSITNNEIDAKLDWIARNGFGRVEIAWVNSTRDESPPAEYLGREWSGLVAHAARSCADRGLGCDFTLGTLWPFGGELVSEEYASRTWTGLSEQRLGRSWEQAYGEPARILDHLNEAALEMYVGRVAGALEDASAGSTVPARFTDSWEVDAVGLWSADFDERFRERYGYDLLRFMPEIDAHPRERYDYRSLVAELVLERFFTPLTRLSHEAGALARVQAHGAPCDLLDAYALADVPESETMLFDPPFATIAASAAATAGLPVVSCETFTCLYGWLPYPELGPHHGEELPGDLKLVADAGFANGVNMVVWHGTPFDTVATTDRFYATTHVSERSAAADELPALNAYLGEMSRALREGTTHSRLAVYLPTEEMRMRGELPPALRRPSAQWHWEMQYARFPEDVAGYRPLWTNANGLARASVRDARIAIGEAAVDAILVDTEWLPRRTVVELLRLIDEGAAVLVRRRPREPGTTTHADYDALVSRLAEAAADRIPVEPMVAPAVAPPAPSADAAAPQLPAFWCRATAGADGPVWRYFFAHPAASGLAYPLEYGASRRARAARMRVTIAGPDRRWETDLVFEPGASLLLDVDSSGVHDRSSAYRCPLPSESGEPGGGRR